MLKEKCFRNNAWLSAPIKLICYRTNCPDITVLFFLLKTALRSNMNKGLMSLRSGGLTGD